MINRFFFLFSALVFLIGNTSSGVASGSFPTHTQYTPELEPASILELNNSYQIVSVCFLGVGGCDEKQNYDVDSASQCRQEGYIKNNCNSAQEADGICPYNSSYIRGCKCKSGLISCPSGQVGVGDSCGGKYASCKCDPNLKTCASNQVGSGASCGGKYQTCTCKPEYQFTSSNCSSPRSVSGASCGGKYNSCVCPKGVSTGAYGCKEYYPSPCSSVCKVAYSDNCHKRTAVQALYGCMSYFADCPSKCERAYPDNCRNRTPITLPTNTQCATYYSDCSSKCSSWQCKPGFDREGDTCKQGCPTNYIYNESNCPIAQNFHCSTVCNDKYSDCKKLLWTGNLVYKAGQPYATEEKYCPGPVKAFTAEASMFLSAYSISNGKDTYRLCTTADKTCHDFAVSATRSGNTPNDVTFNLSANMNCGNEGIRNDNNWYGSVNRIINGNGHTITFDKPSGSDFYNSGDGGALTIKNAKIVSKTLSLPYEDAPCGSYTSGAYKRYVADSLTYGSYVFFENVTIDTQHSVGDDTRFSGNNTVKMISGGQTSVYNQYSGMIYVVGGTTNISGFKQANGGWDVYSKGGVANLNMSGKSATLYMLGGTVNVCADKVNIYSASTGGIVNSSTTNVSVHDSIKNLIKINHNPNLCK